MAGLLVRLAGPSCFRREDNQGPGLADDPADVERALGAFQLRPDHDDPTRLEAGISVYAVDDDATAAALVEERAVEANRGREPRKIGHADYLLFPEELVQRAGLVVEVAEDPGAATLRLREQHREIRLHAGVSNADVPRDELDAALRRLIAEVLGLADLEKRVRRVKKDLIAGGIKRALAGGT